jgi:hypothetical protein
MGKESRSGEVEQGQSPEVEKLDPEAADITAGVRDLPKVRYE